MGRLAKTQTKPGPALWEYAQTVLLPLVGKKNLLPEHRLFFAHSPNYLLCYDFSINTFPCQEPFLSNFLSLFLPQPAPFLTSRFCFPF
jgi:hypothetical protein